MELGNADWKPQITQMNADWEAAGTIRRATMCPLERSRPRELSRRMVHTRVKLPASVYTYFRK